MSNLLPLLPYSLTPLLPYSLTPLLPYSLTPLLPYSYCPNSTALIRRFSNLMPILPSMRSSAF
ncbi:hypothetical protein D7027_17650 [Ochrobactrum intermedium]|nr:hypothetical protein [Brucella intermedia]